MIPRRFIFALCVVTLAGCELFSPRTPEEPIADAGTFVQADQPEQVIANLQAALRELNTETYRRSLAEDFTFEPTSDARQEHAVWSNWGRNEEVSYFTQLAEAARERSGHELTLNEQDANITVENRYVLDANYFLVVRHGRTDVPDTVQGHLVWDIAQGADGLWRLQRWTDEELGTSPSWSELKAAFIK